MNGVERPPFDLASEYESQLARGIRLSGEDRHFFIRGRVAETGSVLGRRPIRRVLDFGCGLGDTSARLATTFPDAEVVGVDTASNALDWAVRHHGGPRVRFAHLDALVAGETFDLCYVNGVFHHIRPEERLATMTRLRTALAPGGCLALFENNPWNPGARLVMSRIPFDRGAVPLSPVEGRRLVRRAGLRPLALRALFFFPRPLALLRGLEPLLRRLPLGAQYGLFAERAP